MVRSRGSEQLIIDEIWEIWSIVPLKKVIYSRAHLQHLYQINIICSALNQVPNLGLNPNWNQSPEMVPKKVPILLERALIMFPVELHHLTATPAKPTSDGNVLSLPPST